MTSNPSTFDLDLERVYLEIDPTVREQAWQQHQFLATPTSRWRAYINQVALQTLLPWLREEAAAGVSLQPMLNQALLPTVWEWVSGSAVDVADWRLVVVPTEAIDTDEFRVPQEWVDVPAWAGDYYVRSQVNIDEGWIKLSGFTTHQALKTKGDYDWRDRTYALPASDLTQDINVMWVSQLRCSEAVKQAAIEPLPALTLPHANSLIQRLSNPSVLNPRLAIDFANWGALMAHGGWRRQMAQQRWGRPSAFAVNQWLRDGIAQFAQQLGWQEISFQPALAGARDIGADVPPQTGLARPVKIGEEEYVLQVLPVESNTPNAWRFELRKLTGLVMPGVTLRLLTEDLQPFENNAISATEPIEALYIDVALEAGEGIVWEIEPMPNQYEPEVLRF